MYHEKESHNEDDQAPEAIEDENLLTPFPMPRSQNPAWTTGGARPF